MPEYRDPLKGLNPDQSGPKEKIQNGDPKSGPNRDQRSHAKEAGGWKPSLDAAEMGGEEGKIPPHEGLVKVHLNARDPFPEGVSGESEPAGAHDRAGHASYQEGRLKDATPTSGGNVSSASGSGDVTIGDIDRSDDDKDTDKVKSKKEAETA